MSKLLLLILAVVVLWRLAKGSRRKERADSAPKPVPERMVSCAHCGLYLPQSEAIGEEGRYFCCAEHRRLAA
ncbi:MAG: PP0621 family protein [Burkholderiales bacterium]